MHKILNYCHKFILNCREIKSNRMNATVNNNFSCEDIRLGGRDLNLPEDLDTAIRFILIGFLALVFPFTIFLNFLTIFLVLKFKHLHQTTFFLALQVIIIDLTFAIITTPIVIASAQAGEWILGLHFCYISGAINAFLRKMRSLIMFVLVFDRFCTVFKPFHYPSKRTKVVLPLCCLALLILVADITVTLFKGCYGFDNIGYFCVNRNGCKDPELCDTYNRAVEITVVVIGSVIPLIMYIILFLKSRRVRNRVAQIESRELLEKRLRERRVNITFLFLFLSVFGVTIVPYFSIFILSPILRAIYAGQLTDGYIVIVYVIRAGYDLLPIVDSIAVMRNPEVRRALKMLKALCSKNRNPVD